MNLIGAQYSDTKKTKQNKLTNEQTNKRKQNKKQTNKNLQIKVCVVQAYDCKWLSMEVHCVIQNNVGLQIYDEYAYVLDFFSRDKHFGS